MTKVDFDHVKLDVYRLAIEYVAESFGIAEQLLGLHRHARDQWVRAAQSIPLNIAEGNGKRSLRDRARFFEIARGSALECAAIQDVLIVAGGIRSETNGQLKPKLLRIVAMLTRLANRGELPAASTSMEPDEVNGGDPSPAKNGPRKPQDARPVAAPDSRRRIGRAGPQSADPSTD